MAAQRRSQIARPTTITIIERPWMTAFCIGAAIFSVSVLNTPRQRRYETRMQCRSSDHPCEACPVLDTGVGRVPPPARGEPVEPCEQVGERAYTYRGGMDSCFRRNGCGQRRDAALTAFLTTPAKAGVYRSWPFDKLRACPVLDTQPLRLSLQCRDARHPFSANLPDRYLWMTLDSSV